MPKPLPKSPYLNERFAKAVTQFGIQLNNAASIKHKGNRGSAREQALRDFFSKNLPSRFSVTQGESVDLLGEPSPQFDLVIYDNTKNFPFSADGVTILPAEAILATVEVKSKLNAGEVTKCVIAARKLRALSPFGRPLGERDIGNAAENKLKLCRFFHCVFAYETNIMQTNWGAKELGRIGDAANGEHLIDMVYVLNAGILNVPAGLYRQDDERGGAISSFFFAILKFIMREASRRDPAPYDRYITHNRKSWVKA